MRTSIRTLGAVAAVTAVAFGTAACTGSGTTNPSQTESDPVELTYWAWAPNLDKVVEIWNEDHPDIQVTVNKQDGGDPAIVKLLTAIEAGSGAPDLIQAEYQKIPTLVANEALADISGNLDGSVESAFNAGDWQAVTLGSDAVYAVPQDSGPMVFYYRADVFDELELAVPTTWDEFADAARAVHEADDSAYLSTFSAADAGWFAGLSQQAGASWWGINGDAWSVDIDATPTQEVAEYWGGLVEEGVIDNKPMYTPEWNAALNEGTQVGWVSAAWGPGVLAGNAADTAGLWEAAPMPTWDGTASSGNWGGSSTAVTSQSEHPQQAAEFITWLNTDPEAVQALVDQTGIYPAAIDAGAQALTDAPEFFANQPDFYDVVAQAAASVQPFVYGPNVNVAYSAYNDEFAKAAEAKTADAFRTAVTNVQTITRDDLVNQGFNVD